MWLDSFRGDHSLSATSAPSLDQLVPSGSLISYQQVRVITVIQMFLLSSQSLFQHNHPNFPSLSHSGGSNSMEWPVLPHPHIRSLFCLQFISPFRWWPTSPQSPYPNSSQQHARLVCSLYDLQPESLPVDLIWRPLDPKTQLPSCARFLYSRFAT
jgi:hypothetical protein